MQPEHLFCDKIFKVTKSLNICKVPTENKSEALAKKQKSC